MNFGKCARFRSLYRFVFQPRKMFGGVNFSGLSFICTVVMKTKFFTAIFAALALFVLTEAGYGQRNIDPQIDRDPILEADAKHNLEVAWQYFKLKKAYKAVLDRCEETIAAHPEFSKMDEVLYLSGMSSYYLSENKGSQKVNLKTEKDRERFAPEKLREDAEAYLGMLVEKYPDSKYRNTAEETLKILKKNK